jgi:hypothetical protein
MKSIIFLLILNLSISASAQVVQGCPTCPPKLFLGETDEEMYQKLAMREMLNLNSLDSEITKLIIDNYKKLHPDSKTELKNILNVYSFLVLLKTDTKNNCKDCIENLSERDKILTIEIRKKIKLFIESKYLRSYLYDQYNQNQVEMDSFIQGMEKFK